MSGGGPLPAIARPSAGKQKADPTKARKDRGDDSVWKLRLVCFEYFHGSHFSEGFSGEKR
jgi:hypothetical protein